MFSVEDSPARQFGIPTSSLSAGWELANFDYRGDPDQAGVNRYDFSSMSMFRFHFENPGINLYLGLGGSLTGSSDQNYLNIGALLYNDFILLRDEDYRFTLPLQINTDLVRTRQDLNTQQFQQTAFQIGAGLGYWHRLTERLHADARIVPNIGFSNSQGSFVGGSVFTFDGKLRVHILRLLGNQSLVAGYDFRFRSYNIDAEIFNYDLLGHTLSLGIAF